MKINYKSGYFWGAIFAIIFLGANVASLNIVMNIMDKKLSSVDFSQIEIKDLHGNNTTLKDIANGKKVLLNFWATWCGPCLSEFPIIQKAYENENIKDDYVFVMVSDETIETITAFQEKTNYTFSFMKIGSRMDYGVLALQPLY